MNSIENHKKLLFIIASFFIKIISFRCIINYIYGFTVDNHQSFRPGIHDTPASNYNGYPNCRSTYPVPQ